MARTLHREALHTVQFVPLTAFDNHGQLDLQPMRAIIRRLVDAGASVFIPCAGSSEFHSLLADEIVATVEMVREVAGDNAVVLAPVGLQPGYAAELGQRSLAAGADGVLVMPLVNPYLSDPGARDYYLTLMDQLQCPTLIYKKAEIPSDDLLLELAGHPHLWGVKYAINELDALQTTIRRDAGRLDWFCGNAERFAPYFALAGSPGYTSGAGNLCPRLTLAMHAALACGDWDEALRLQQIILPIEHYRARSNSSYNISFLKYAISLTGIDVGLPRPPYRQLTDVEKNEITELIQPIWDAEQAMAAVAIT